MGRCAPNERAEEYNRAGETIPSRHECVQKELRRNAMIGSTFIGRVDCTVYMLRMWWESTKNPVWASFLYEQESSYVVPEINKRTRRVSRTLLSLDCLNPVSRRVLKNSKYALPMRARVSSRRHLLAILWFNYSAAVCGTRPCIVGDARWGISKFA